jgi:hypothetical protein
LSGRDDRTLFNDYVHPNYQKNADNADILTNGEA